MSVLHEAVACGDLERLCDLLAQNRHDKNEKDDDWEGRTPLFWAVLNGRLDCVKALLQAGANPTVQNSTQKSPAHYAAASGQSEVLKMLVDYGCDTKVEDLFGDTALDYALLYGNLECGEFLVRVLSGGYEPKIHPSAWSERRSSAIHPKLAKYLSRKHLTTPSDGTVDRHGHGSKFKRQKGKRK